MPASAVVALERYVLELPAQARSYFEVVEEGGALTSFVYELALLVAITR